MNTKENKKSFEIENIKVEIKRNLDNFYKKRITISPESTHGRLIRIEVEAENIDVLSWLNNQKAEIRTYWSNRSRAFEMAGIGEAYLISIKENFDTSSVFEEMKNILSPEYKDLKFYGGFRFNKKRPCDEEWNLFGCCRFIIPRFEVYVNGAIVKFACNFFYDPKQKQQEHYSDLLKELDEVIFDDKAELKNGNYLETRHDFPNKDDWCRNVKTALRIFDHTDLIKIVFARKSTFTFRCNVNPIILVRNLKNANPDAYHFCFQPGNNDAFIGGTPERLFLRKGREILSEAVAGTRPRGKSPDEDMQFEKELLTSVKDIHEHHVVHLSIQMSMQRLCDSIETDQNIQIVKLAKLQHLKTSFKGYLAGHVTDPDIVEDLHPTPAVGGEPKEKAINKINELEKFDRGFYAAPVGWVGVDDVEFSVGIRTGLVQNNLLTLYSGAGIVKGSVPDEEWQEVENKICTFMNILKIHDK